MNSRLAKGLAVVGAAALLGGAAIVGVTTSASAATALRATISVQPQTVLANGQTTTITLKLFKGTTPVKGTVLVLAGLSLPQAQSQRAQGSCGTGTGLNQGGAPTQFVASTKGVKFTYHAGSHVGFCYISARAAGSPGSTWTPQSWIMVAQKDPVLAAAHVHYTAALVPVKGTVSTRTVRPSSISQTCANPLAVCKTWTLTVKNGAIPVPNVTVGQICVVDSPPTPPADSVAQIGCGPMALTSPTTHVAATKTNASGQINMTYTASNTAGNYDLWVQEASTGAKSQYVELKQF
jgi:hypothetical protein